MRTKQALFKAIRKRVSAEHTAFIHLASIASVLDVDPSALTRYLTEASAQGWLRSETVFGGTKVTVLDKSRLEDAAGLMPEVRDRG